MGDRDGGPHSEKEQIKDIIINLKAVVEDHVHFIGNILLALESLCLRGWIPYVMDSLTYP